MSDLFYPDKKRRSVYSKTIKGTYYTSYNHYRQEIREDSLFRCVYCDIHEAENGGDEHMNLDHFRPKGLDRFSLLVNDPNNLVWSCAGCNNLKRHHWPVSDEELPFVGKEGFIDPFADSYRVYFSISDEGLLTPLKDPAQYMIMILALNRESRKRVRELRIIKNNLINAFSLKIDDLIIWEKEIMLDVSLNDEQKASEAQKVDEMRSWLVMHLEMIKKLIANYS